MAQTTLTFLGIASAVPEAGEDTASFLVNGELLFDCGWANVLQMRACKYDPLQVRTLFFTHCHHDHYLGLPALLFYRSMRSAPAPLTIIGPPDDLPIVVERSLSFLQAERFEVMQQELNLVPLEPGATWENERYQIQTVRALHPVTAVCGRLTDKQTGAVIAFTGDTSPNQALKTLAQGADLLIHEASISPDGKLDDRWGHSRSIDAAQTALEANAKSLRLVHASARHREASLQAAQAIFPNTQLAAQGETLTWAGD
jgi:ribonuclease Z